MQLNILKKYFVFLFLILMSLMVHAQPSVSISGRILDVHTHRPIEFVNVALLGPDSTFLSGVVSDTLGIFLYQQVIINQVKNIS